MKNFNRILFLFAFLISISIAFVNAVSAQNSNVDATLNSEFVFHITEKDLESDHNSHVSIAHLEFSTEESLASFCHQFSNEYMKLLGSYKNKEIILEFDNSVIKKLGINSEDINQDFRAIAPRMQYYYSNYK